MHSEAWQYVQAATDGIHPLSVVDLGARDVNGSPRCLFPFARYVGIDIFPGPSVDVVADASQWVADTEYDLALCLEVMEHTPHWPGIIRTAHKALRTDGLFVVTAATSPRAPHSAIDGGPLHADEFYENVDPYALGEVMSLAGFGHVQVTVRDWGDVYAIGTRE